MSAKFTISSKKDDSPKREAARIGNILGRKLDRNNTTVVIGVDFNEGQRGAGYPSGVLLRVLSRGAVPKHETAPA